jgi:hypothetical protein
LGTEPEGLSGPADYARRIEAYLCQKNGGHLVRVVGPAFDMVRGWAETGVPLRVAFRGIDRCCARIEAKGGRRRPVRIDFCEADVLDAFDEWRRAIGVTAGAGTADGAPARRPALAAHMERAMARLAHVRGSGPAASPLHTRIDEVVRAIEAMLPAAPRARGDARAALVARLSELDRALMDTVVVALPAETARRLQSDAAVELGALAARMPADARQQALEAAFRRLVRDEAGLPTLEFE